VSAEKKRELIELVRRSPQPKRTTIAEMGLSRSTFYRWQRRYRDQGEAGLVDRKPDPGAVWNRLRPAEKTVIVETALQQPDLSSRELPVTSPTMSALRSRTSLVHLSSTNPGSE